MWTGWKGTRLLSLYCGKLALNCDLSDGGLAVLFFVCFSEGDAGEAWRADPKIFRAGG